MEKWYRGEWGLILGSSSGFGLATAKRLAFRGMNLFGVHFDRRGAIDKINQEIDEMKSQGVEVEFFNYNAVDEEKRKQTIQAMKERMGHAPLRCILHSLAFGTLRDYFAENIEAEITPAQMEMTLNVMAHSLVYWIQDLRREGLIQEGTRIFAMTSSGGGRVWPHYGAVSAAKAALESHIRQIALELAPYGIRANSICAGVTDTPALRKIPGHEALINGALARNPSKRLTNPEDIGNVIALLSHPDAAWMTGNVIYVDGGEEIVG
ncbi:MAG: SDR family oxidoreductase [Candidatus Omnitrophota bacterium]